MCARADAGGIVGGMNSDDARDDEYGGGEYSVDEDNQLQPADTLDDRGVADMLDEGYSPPERPLAMNATATTGDEVRYGGSLAHRVAAEEPDPPRSTPRNRMSTRWNRECIISARWATGAPAGSCLPTTASEVTTNPNSGPGTSVSTAERRRPRRRRSTSSRNTRTDCEEGAGEASQPAETLPDHRGAHDQQHDRHHLMIVRLEPLFEGVERLPQTLCRERVSDDGGSAHSRPRSP